MTAKNIYNYQKDSIITKNFDAKYDDTFITLKTEPKNWVDDSLIGKTIFLVGTEEKSNKIIFVGDTMKAPNYFIFQKEADYKYKHKYVKSIFLNHSLRSETITPQIKDRKNIDWGLGVFLFGFTLLALANFYYLKRFSLFTKAFFLQRFTSQLMREDNSQTQRLSILLSTLYLISMSLFALKANEISNLFHYNRSPINNFLLVGLALLSFFTMKIVLNYLVGFIFKTEKEISEYIFNIILLNQFLGIALFFLCFIFYYVYSKYSIFLLILGLVLILSIYLYRIIRGIISVNNNKNISTLYLFLYFCTLEILPLIFITKLLLG